MHCIALPAVRFNSVWWAFNRPRCVCVYVMYIRMQVFDLMCTHRRTASKHKFWSQIQKGTAAIGEKGHGTFGRENVKFSRGTTASVKGTRQEIWGLRTKYAASLQKALYAETRAYKDVRIHHATLNAKASLWLLLHTAHPACARLTPNTEQINHRTNCNIPYIWIFWSHTSRGYDRARHAGKKWRGEIDHPWERGWYTPYGQFHQKVSSAQKIEVKFVELNLK